MSLCCLFWYFGSPLSIVIHRHLPLTWKFIPAFSLKRRKLKSSPFSQANPESYLVTIDFQFNFYLSLKHGLIYYIFCWVNKTILQLSDSLSIPNLHLIPFFPSRRFVDAYFSFWCPHKKWLWIYVSFGSCVKRRCTSCATLTI
jgi:hypothetical protein